MEKRKVDSLLRQSVIRQGRVTSVSVRSYVVVYRLCDTVEEEGSTNTTGKQHAEPGGIVILRHTTVMAKLDISILAVVDHKDEDNPDILESCQYNLENQQYQGSQP